MSRFLTASVILLTLLVTAQAAERKPNVVILFTDDQGTLDVNCYGSTDLYTPSMDRIAAEGVRFTQAYAHTVCCPARAMFMTGRYPQRSNVNHWTQGNLKSPFGRNMDLSEVTLAEALKSAGYKTALFGKWHLGAAATHGPTKQGFDVFFGHRGGFIDNYNHFFLHGKGFHDLYRGTTEQFRRGEYFPDLVTDEALRYIESNKDSLFLLYLAFNIPHYPEQGDVKFAERYKDLPMPRRSYATMISTTDGRVGRVLAKLDELKLTDDTIVIFMSDNGHSAEHNTIRFDDHNSGLRKGHYYGAHGGGGNTGKWRGHKGQFYEGGIRVPAMIRYPRALPKGVVRGQAVTACDWMPTVLDLCGVAKPKGVTFDGSSLVPIIKDNAPSHYKVLHWQWHLQWAVREGDWKLIGGPRDRVELVNLADPEPERVNHAKQRPEVVKRLRGLHDAWVKQVSPTP